MIAPYRPLALAAALVVSAAFPAAASDWPVFGHDPARSGYDASDRILNAGNVAKLAARWQITLGTIADSTPILLSHVSVGGVTRAMLFQTTKSGVTYGVDAHTGKILWHFATRGPNITTSTPAADPSGTAIYAPGVDGFVHKLDPASGKEIAGAGFPARITRMTQTEKDASALNVANGYLYATTSGYFGDAPPYDGHVVSVHLSDGVTRVFNSLCSNKHFLPTPTSCSESDSGIWSRGGAVVDPDPAMNGEVYAATGNGDFDANKGGHNYGDSVLALKGDASALSSSYTPTDYDSLQNGDTDLGSTSPGLLPRQSASHTPLMLVQGGKDQILRLLDRSHLPGVGGELQSINLPDRLYATPAIWTDSLSRAWVFLAFPRAVQGYRLTTNAQGVSSLAGVWTANPGQTGGEGTSPVISNGILFVAFDGAIFALDARTGHALWNSAQPSAGKTIGPVHWESPIVINGWVYCSDENGHLTAYALR